MSDPKPTRDRYECWGCKTRHATENMVAYCASCYSRQTEALKACQERCAGVEKERDYWRLGDSSFALVQAAEAKAASSRQRAERWEDVIRNLEAQTRPDGPMADKGVNLYCQAALQYAALADDKPQESLECKHRFFPYYPGNGWVQCSQCGLTKDQASPEVEKP